MLPPLLALKVTVYVGRWRSLPPQDKSPSRIRGKKLKIRPKGNLLIIPFSIEGCAIFPYKMKPLASSFQILSDILAGAV
jgi:hypothetical protein